MKELFTDIRLIIQESLSIFCKNAMTGRLSFSILDAVGYLLAPLLIIILIFYADFSISDSLSESIIGILSLFVVLAFQVVYIATDKFASRICKKVQERKSENSVRLYDDERNYLKRLGNYTRQFVRQLVLLLLLSLFIILCSTIGLCVDFHIVQVTLSALILSSFYIWLLLLMKMIVSIYKLQMDDIEQNYKYLRE